MRRALVAIGIVLAAVPSTRAVTLTGSTLSAEPPTARSAAIAAEHCKEGDRALKAKDSDAAAAAYGAALAAFPDHPGAHVGLGHVAMLRRDYALALDEYNRAQTAWNALRASAERARAEKSQKAAEGAAAIMEYVNRTSEDSVEAVTIPGMPHTSDSLKGAMLGNQVKDLRNAAQETAPAAGAGIEGEKNAGPPVAVAFFRGTALYRLGRIDEAVAAWRDVEARDPGFAPVYNNLVEGLLRLGRKDEARAEVKAADDRGFSVHPALVAAAEK